MSIVARVNDSLKSKAYYFNYNNSLDRFIEHANQKHSDQAPIIHLKNKKQVSDFLTLQPPNDQPSHTIAVVGVFGNHRQAASIMKYPDGHNTVLALDTLDHDSDHWIDKIFAQETPKSWLQAMQSHEKTKTLMVNLDTQEGYTTCGDHSVSMAKAMRKHKNELQHAHNQIEQTPHPLSIGNHYFLKNLSPELLAKLLVHTELLSKLEKKSELHGIANIPFGKKQQSISQIISSRKASGLTNTSIHEKRTKLLRHVSWRKLLCG